MKKSLNKPRVGLLLLRRRLLRSLYAHTASSSSYSLYSFSSQVRRRTWRLECQPLGRSLVVVVPTDITFSFGTISFVLFFLFSLREEELIVVVVVVVSRFCVYIDSPHFHTSYIKTFGKKKRERLAKELLTELGNTNVLGGTQARYFIFSRLVTVTR